MIMKSLDAVKRAKSLRGGGQPWIVESSSIHATHDIATDVRLQFAHLKDHFFQASQNLDSRSIGPFLPIDADRLAVDPLHRDIGTLVVRKSEVYGWYRYTGMSCDEDHTLCFDEVDAGTVLHARVLCQHQHTAMAAAKPSCETYSCE